MNKHIVLLVGGRSREREVSQMSGKSVHNALLNLGYKVTAVDPNENLANELIRLKPDIIFNCLHGTFGEDGSIPGLLELLRIPYTHSGVTASAIAMDKILTKKMALVCNINTPKYIKIEKTALFALLEKGEDPMQKPYVIKSVQQGSTIGIYLIIDENSNKPKKEEWSFGDQVLIEEYIPGQELSVAVLNDKALGVLELRPRTNWYDYTAKYSDGVTEHIYPAEISQEVYLEAMQSAEEMHKTIGCRTVSRSDFRYNNIGNASGLFFLEINTHPGFTNLSIVPDIASHHGISFEQIIEQLVKDAKCEIML
ncbi:MAG: D-alanine--D-alanine ligase [Candidatus Midichloria sp.]|nr:MAG: D-alanine--D-alanine ligase [Candidatus Midichloria sp.]